MALGETYTKDYTTKKFQLHKFPILKLIKKQARTRKIVFRFTSRTIANNVVLGYSFRVDDVEIHRGRNVRLHFNGIINRVSESEKNSSLIKRLKHINISPGTKQEANEFLLFFNVPIKL
jgi:hypothetical protein